MTQARTSFVPTQKIVGLQVIDIKGTLVGSVKDVAVDVKAKEIKLIVSTRSQTEVDIPWSDIQSIEDVVLLSKEMEIPKAVAPVAVAPEPTRLVSSCPNCGTSVPSHAKFCPRCGTKIR
jgi:sporulation protein YlmC with PRC-barrel domain/ribosomal protein S27AE